MPQLPQGPTGSQAPHRPSVAERASFMGGLVPPRVTGSPVDLPDQPRDALRPEFATMFDGDVPWWRPGPLDIAKAMRWWWLLIVPILLVIGVVTYALFTNLLWQSKPALLKLLVFLFASIGSIVGYHIRHVVQSRRDRFCIHCGYSLEGLPDGGTCPECGRPFRFALVDEYKKDPHFFAHRYNNARQLPARVVAFRAGEGPTPDDGTQ